MTRQTNIGLLLALIFIVAFSLVLTEFRQPAQDINQQQAANEDPKVYINMAPRITSDRPVVRPELRNRRTRPAAANNSVAQRPAPARPAVQPAREVAVVTPSPVQTVTPAPAVSNRGITPVAPVAGTITMQHTAAGQPYSERTVDEFERDMTGTAGPAIAAQTPANAAQLPDAQQVQNRVYVVINGDNLRKISKKVYKSDNKWRKIYNANRNKLKNPNDIQVGMKLVIPEA